MKLGSNLESLEFDIPLSQSITKKKFFEALPNLEHLTIHFNHTTLSETENWYPCDSNLKSVKLCSLSVFRPPEMIRLLTNTRLKHLDVHSDHVEFNKESFEKLVVSQLSTVSFNEMKVISNRPVIIPNFLLQANKTVEYFYLTAEGGSDPTEIIFPKYFLGLVHLTIRHVTDSILQCIFRYQENLRSLKLEKCFNCSINGFCGSKDGGSEYSINSLQKLEHLTIMEIKPEVIKSDDFKCAFSFSRLKYLRIDTTGRRSFREYAEIPTELYKNLTELRALRLKDTAMPSHETLSSLFSRLKNLNYLRYDMSHSDETATHSVTFINDNHEHFPITVNNYEKAFSYGQAYYDTELDRVVILNDGLWRIFASPKFSTFQIDWIDA